MSLLHIPCYYYPTMAILLDDNERFITKLALVLNTELAYKSISDPILAIQYIQTYSPAKSPMQMIVSERNVSNNENSATLQTTINLEALYKEIYNANRFNEPSVIVVDYSMPNMNGLDFCRKIKNSPIKKIMLTGQADENLGIQAFNEGLIDKFILKNDSNFDENVSNAINELQICYIRERSAPLLNVLTSQSLLCLKDPAFIELFEDICSKYKIVEYYLIQNSGSYLLLQYDGTPLWLIVMNDSILNDYSTIAKDNNMPKDITDALCNKQKIPFFAATDKAQSLEWNTHLYSAEKLAGQQTYYYTLIKDMPAFFKLLDNRILILQGLSRNGVAPQLN